MFILFAAPLVNNIPLAALVGLMFMVVIGTFERETLRYKGKVPYEDLFIILIVMIITIVQDLATAMII